MALKDTINADMKSAMREKDSARLDAIRMLKAAIQRREVDEQITLDDDGIVSVVEKQIKQSRDAIEQFTAGGRADLADKEQASVEVMQAYLPEPLGPEEIEQIVQSAISDTGAASIRDMGKVMGMIKPKLQGRADMSVVSARVKSILG